MTTKPPLARHSPDARTSIRAAQTGVAINLMLAAGKITAGVVGNTYAFIADGVESLADVAASSSPSIRTGAHGTL